jgi:hypothetical protein
MKSVNRPSFRLGVGFWLFLALSLASAQSPTPTPSLEQRVTDLEKRLNALEAIPAITQALNVKKQTGEDSAVTSPTPRGDSPLELVDWNFSFEAGKYGQAQYKITYTLKNRTDKDIKLNQSGIELKDLLGEKVYGIRVNQDLRIPAGKEVSGGGYYSANPFIPEEMRLKGMSKENINAELLVLKAVFTDNSIYSAQESK